MTKTLCIIVSFLVCAWFACGDALAQSPPLAPVAAVKLPRASAVPGGIAIVKIADASNQTVAPLVRLDGNLVWVAKQNGAWLAVAGLALSTKAGEHFLDVDANNQAAARKVSFTVKSKQYAVQRLTITNKAMVDPPADVQTRIDNESKHLSKVRSTFTASDKTQGAFALPAVGKLSSKFGQGRVLNGQVRSPHAGLDLAIGVGTPVTAAADGVLLDADDYYYCGKTAFIDHGNGLISMHCHLSEFIAKAGDSVKRGDLIGKSGVTGRITGPHLHWSIYLNATSVDPELFLNQMIPKF